jgi:pyruvate dehydrogenase E1 component
LNTSGSNHGPAAPLSRRAASNLPGLPISASDRHRAMVEDLLRLVLEGKSPQEARQLISGVIDGLREQGLAVPDVTSTPYLNTIPVEEQPEYPGDLEMERLIRAHVRWNAMAMVAKANKTTNVGGHIATFASLATLYEVGFNHFFRGGADGKTADMIYFQGHASPGNYARAYLEYRLNDQHLTNFRQELQDHPGLSSYPHPFLMPDFWIFPRPASAATSRPGSSCRRTTTRWSGPSSATANRMNPRPTAPSGWPDASTSTTSSGW